MLLGSKHYVNLNKYHLHCHRASLNWELVWRDAAKIVSNLVCRSPELKRTVFFFEGSTGGEGPPPDFIQLYVALDGLIVRVYKGL